MPTTTRTSSCLGFTSYPPSLDIAAHFGRTGRTSDKDHYRYTQIPHLKKWKTSLEPAVKRAMMIWYKQKPITNEVHPLCSKELCLSSTPRRRTRPV